MKRILIALAAVILMCGAANATIVAQWKLDEASGTRYDMTTNDLDLTESGTVSQANDRESNALAAGFSGACALSRAVGSGTALDIKNDTPLTLSFWVYPTAFNETYGAYLFGKWAAAAVQYAAFVSPTGKLRFYYGNGGTDYLESASTLSLNTWYHVVMRADGEDCSIHINGNATADASKTYGSITYQADAGFMMGEATFGLTGFRLDDVIIANNYFSTDDISTYYNYAANFANNITITAHTANRIYQRTPGGSTGPITIAGTYAGTVTTIQYRMTDTASWATLDSSPSGGTYSEVVTVACGGPYQPQVRFSNNTGVTATDANSFYVGATFVIAGQSNANYMSNHPAAALGITVNSLAKIRKLGTGLWQPMNSTYTTNGAGYFADKMADTLNIPIGIIESAVNASALRAEGDMGFGEWWNETNDTPAALYTAMATAVDGSSVEGFVWYQGEADAISDLVTQAEYKDSLQHMIDKSRTDFGTGRPWVIIPIARYDDTLCSWQAIKNALYEVINGYSNCYIGMDPTSDGAMWDTIHIGNAMQAQMGTAAANSMLYAIGASATYTREKMLGYTAIDSSTIDIVCSHDIDAASSAFTGFAVTGTGVSITDAQRHPSINRRVRLTISGGTSNVTGVSYNAGQVPTVTDPVIATASDLPLESNPAITDGVDITNPSITITDPSSDATYQIVYAPGTDVVTFEGTASDDVGVTSVTHTCDNCTAGATGTATGTTSWSFSSTLDMGENTITVTAYDAFENSATDTITITLIERTTPATWYLNCSAVSDGDGSSSSPFNNMTSLLAAGVLAIDTIWQDGACGTLNFSTVPSGATLKQKKNATIQGITGNGSALLTGASGSKKIIMIGR